MREGREEGPEIVERHIEVRRTARYAVLGEDVAAPEEVWFVLHGYRQLARRFLRRFRRLHQGRRRIVAPEALSRFYVGRERGRHGPDSVVGGTWMTREDRLAEIDDYVAYLDRLAGTTLADLPRDPEVTVLGFSQGVHTASRWVTYGSVRPRRLVLWGDYLPPDLEMDRAAEALQEVELVIVRGERDRSLRDDLERQEREWMEAAGIRATEISYPGGHEIHGETLLGLAGPSGSQSSAASAT